MALRKGYTSLVLSTVLIAMLALESLCQPIPAPENRYQTFLRQHYDNPRTNPRNRYCNAMMQQRDLTHPECKNVNTFIHGTRNNILNVCTDEGGRHYEGDLRVSLQPFSTTTCKLMGGSTRPPCEYRQTRSQRYIVIACNNENQPVHFAERIIVTTRP